MKGSSAQFGAIALSNASTELEQAGKSANWSIITQKAECFLNAAEQLLLINELSDKS